MRLMGHNLKMVEKAKRATSSKLKSIPKFKSEEEERHFWETQDTTKYFSGKIARFQFPHLKPSTSFHLSPTKDLWSYKGMYGSVNFSEGQTLFSMESSK